MHQLLVRPWITAGVALMGASVIAVTPTTVPLRDVHVLDIQLTTGAEQMVLDLVRHGQSTDNVAGIVGTTPPGAPLTDCGDGQICGVQQAITVGQALYNHGDNNIDGVYASEFLRTQQTAWPLDQLLQGNSDYDVIPGGPTPLLDPSQILSGLNEVNAGFFNNTPEWLGGLPYIVPIVEWMLGNFWFPMLGSASNPNGMAFEDRFNDAIQTIYNAGGPTADGELHDVAFTHGAAMLAWTVMTVKNPDLSVILHDPMLPNTAQVVIQGDPTDGWTLVSWNGVDVPQTPDLLSGLFVDYRDLVTAPQMALWHIWEAILGGDSTQIMTAIHDGFHDVITALFQFPVALYDTIIDALHDAGSGATAAVSGELAATAADALAAA